MLFILTNIFFCLATFRDPGFAKKTLGMNFFQLVEHVDNPEDLCPTCEIAFTSEI